MSYSAAHRPAPRSDCSAFVPVVVLTLALYQHTGLASLCLIARSFSICKVSQMFKKINESMIFSDNVHTFSHKNGDGKCNFCGVDYIMFSPTECSSLTSPLCVAIRFEDQGQAYAQEMNSVSET